MINDDSSMFKNFYFTTNLEIVNPDQSSFITYQL